MGPQPRLGSELEPWTVAMPYQQKTVFASLGVTCVMQGGGWGVAGVDWDRLALSVCGVWKKSCYGVRAPHAAALLSD